MRLPRRQEIFHVFAFVVVIVHSWTIYGFIHEVPSFLLYFKINQIAAILAYMMGFALLESSLVTLGLTSLSLVLPVSWFRIGFVYKSMITVLVWGCALLWLENTLLASAAELPEMSVLLSGLGVTLAAWVILLFLAHTLEWVPSMLMSLIERVEVLAYVYIPLGGFGLVVVLVRNLM